MNKRIVLYAFAVPCLVAFVLIGACVALWITDKAVPDELKQWTAVAIGYVFGFLPVLVRESLDPTAGT